MLVLLEEPSQGIFQALLIDIMIAAFSRKKFATPQQICFFLHL